MNQFLKIIALGMLMSTLALQGQTDSSARSPLKKERSNDPRFTLGFIGGPNTFLFQDAINPPKSMLGFDAGLDLQFCFGQHSALVANVMLEKKSYSNNYYHTGRINEHELSSVTVPILFRRSMGKKNLFFVNAGIVFSNQYHINTTISFTGATSYAYNVGYAGLAAGFGSRIPLGKKMAVTLEFRDHIKLAEVYSSNKRFYFDHTPPDVTHTASFLLGVSYGFGTRKINPRFSDSTRLRKLMVKLFYAPQLCFNTMRSSNVRLEDSYYGNSHTSYSYDGRSEIPHLGQEAGIILEFLRREHFNLNIGLTYDQLRFRTKATTLYHSGWGDLLGSYSGSYANTVIHYKFDFISLPVTANYVYRKKKCSYYAGGGIELKKLLSSEVGFSYSFGYTKKFQYHLGSDPNNYYKVDPLNYSVILNVGADVPVANGTSLFFEPAIKYGLPVNVPVATNIVSIWSASCKVGLKF